MSVEPPRRPVLRHGRFDHVALVVPSIAAALAFWRDTLGFRAGDVHEVAAQGVRAVFLASGATRIELIEPVDTQSGVARFLAERDGRATLHHLGFVTGQIDAALAELLERGYRLVDLHPRPGAERPVAFLHPSAADGVLVELLAE